MRRGTPNEDLDAGYEIAQKRGHALRARFAEISACIGEINAGIPRFRELPLRFREKQIWRPLFVLCSVFCPDRMAEFTRAAADMSSEKKTGKQVHSKVLRQFERQADQETWGRWLLEDITKVMRTSGRKAIETEELISALYGIDEAPWRKFGGAEDLEDDGLTPQKSHTCWSHSVSARADSGSDQSGRAHKSEVTPSMNWNAL